MALTTAQQVSELFKAAQNKGSTDPAKQFFEEPKVGFPFVLPSQVWNQASTIPNTAPTLADGSTSGVVTYYAARTLTFIAGSTASGGGAFQLDIFKNTIPFYYGDGTSYNYTLTTSTGVAIPFGTNDWLFDPNTGTLTFYNGLPSGVASGTPPKFSAWTYTGTFGVGSGSGGGGGGNANANPNGAAGVTDWSPTSDQISTTVLSTTFLSAPGFNGNFQLAQNAPVQFYASSGTIISPLVAGTTYYANVVGGTLGALTNVSATSGGTAISGYAAGSGTTFMVQARPDSASPSYVPQAQTQFTIAPLSPAGNGFVIASAAANVIGMNIEKPITLASPWDMLKPLQISFDYDTTTTTFIAGSITFWLEEISTGIAVQLSSSALNPLAATKGSLVTQILPSSYFSTVALKLVARWNNSSSTAQSIRVGNIAYQTLYTQQVAVLQTIPDSNIQINGFGFAVGSTATKIISFSSGTVIQNVGSGVQYLDDSVNGARFVALTSGTYSVNFCVVLGTSAGIGLSKNSANLTTAFSALPKAEQLIADGNSTTSALASLSWTGPLVTGDIVRIHNDAVTSYASTSYSSLSVSQIGTVKAINAVANQTLTLPTSEVSFVGAAARGSTDTFVAKYDTMTNLRGDGFTVTNTAANGTIIQINRNGLLDITAGLGASTSQSIFLSRNQAVLTAQPATTEVLDTGSASANGFGMSASWAGKVYAGDKFRVVTDSNPSNATKTIFNTLTALFQDDAISVAINTVQPQWSQSDSAVRVTTVNGFGSTNTAVRRFSNVESSVGSDLTYTDSATLGGSWLVNTQGEYQISYTDSFGSSSFMGINRNGTSLSTSPQNATLAETLALNTSTSTFYVSTSWQGQLNVGDTIRATASPGAGATGTLQSFTISKIGKPNLTSVDVTPFLLYNDKVTDLVTIVGASASGGASIAPAATRSTNLGVFSYNSSTGTYTVIKRGLFIIAATGTGALATSGLSLSKNGTVVATDIGTAFALSYSDVLEVADALSFRTTGGPTATVSALNIQVAGIADSGAIQAPSSITTNSNTSFVFKSSPLVSTDAVGTFNTYTYTASSNTPTIATTAPTQTLTDMSANGLQVYTRLSTSLSTAALPVRFDIKLPSGLSTPDVASFFSAGSTTALDSGYDYLGAATETGFHRYYDKASGVLTIEGGTFVAATTSTASRYIGIGPTGPVTMATQAFLYFLFTAARVPVTVAVNANDPRNIRYQATSGQSIATGTTPTLVVWDSAPLEGLSGYLIANQYKATKSGRLAVAATVQFASMTTVAGAQFQASIYKNGVLYKGGTIQLTTGITTGAYSAPVNDVVTVVAGDLVDIRISQTTGAARSLATAVAQTILTVSYNA